MIPLSFEISEIRLCNQSLRSTVLQIIVKARLIVDGCLHWS